VLVGRRAIGTVSEAGQAFGAMHGLAGGGHSRVNQEAVWSDAGQLAALFQLPFHAFISIVDGESRKLDTYGHEPEFKEAERHEPARQVGCGSDHEPD
jgi:hypothetical protein